MKEPKSIKFSKIVDNGIIQKAHSVSVIHYSSFKLKEPPPFIKVSNKKSKGEKRREEKRREEKRREEN